MWTVCLALVSVYSLPCVWTVLLEDCSLFVAELKGVLVSGDHLLSFCMWLCK